jgi:aminoglycoside 2''-phosphotransferase
MDAQPIAQLIEACFPHVHVHHVVFLAEGWDSTVWEVNGELVFRFPKRPEVQRTLATEIRLLPELAQRVPLPIPRFEYVWRGDPPHSAWFVGYRKLDGICLSSADLQTADPARLARQLAAFLSELHRFPVDRATQLSVPCYSPSEWHEEYQGFYNRVRQQVLPLLTATRQAAITGYWESYLEDDANFRFAPALIHRDLGYEHILFDPGTGALTGIIDFGDAAVGDPAIDFSALLYDYGREFVELMLSGYPGAADPTFRQRFEVYARLIPFREILFGLDAGEAVHVARGLNLLVEAFC